jgi:hypothetical protein
MNAKKRRIGCRLYFGIADPEYNQKAGPGQSLIKQLTETGLSQ